MIIYKNITRTEKELVFMSLEDKRQLIDEARLYIDLLNIEELKIACFYTRDDCKLNINYKALETFLRKTHEHVVNYKKKNPDNRIFKE